VGSKPPFPEDHKPKGNGMTPKYDTDTLLPFSVDAIHNAHSQPDGELEKWILYKDRNPNHCKKRTGLTRVYVESN
jgi:hypothetical protein